VERGVLDINSPSLSVGGEGREIDAHIFGSSYSLVKDEDLSNVIRTNYE
jgi:hypothetical protein